MSHSLQILLQTLSQRTQWQIDFFGIEFLRDNYRIVIRTVRECFGRSRTFLHKKNRRHKNRLQLSYVFEYTIVGANSVRPFPVSFYVTHISPIPIFSVKASILNSHCDMLFVYDLCTVHIRNSSCDFKYAVIGSC